MIFLYIALGLCIIPLYLIYKPPESLINYFQSRWQDVLWHVQTDRKIVALTIDDAPSQYTDEILEALKRNEAAATFFVIGAQVAGQEATLRNIVSNGNELGNHALHDEPSRKLDDDTLAAHIRGVETKINDAYTFADIPPPPQRYFRPGSGFFSTRMRELVKNMGYRMVLGSIYPHDPQVHSSRINGRHILSMLRPGGIIICHDRRKWTAPMLKEVLPEIKRKGYQVVTITQLLEQTQVGEVEAGSH